MDPVVSTLEHLSLVKCSNLRCLAIGLVPDIGPHPPGGGTAVQDPWSLVPILTAKTVEALKKQKQQEREAFAVEASEAAITAAAALMATNGPSGVLFSSSRSLSRRGGPSASVAPSGSREDGGGSIAVEASGPQSQDLSWRPISTRAFAALKSFKLNITSIQVPCEGGGQWGGGRYPEPLSSRVDYDEPSPDLKNVIFFLTHAIWMRRHAFPHPCHFDTSHTLSGASVVPPPSGVLGY